MPRWSLTVLLALSAASAGWLAAGRLPSPPLLPDLPPASSDGCLRVDVALQGAALDPADPEVYARVEVRADADCPTRAVGADLALVLDTSGSMAAAGKLDEARRAARGVVDALGDADRVALVTFSDRARLEWPLDRAAEPLRTLVSGLRPEGGTALSAGLDEAFAALGPADGRAARVLLMTDGLANQGVTDPDALRRRYAGRAPALSTVGLGVEYDESLLRALATTGRGAYHYAESGAALASIFAEELDQARRLAVRDVRVPLRPGAGVRVAEVVGWEGTADGEGGAEVAVGDLAAGESRVLVVRLVHDGGGPARLSADAVGAGATGGFTRASAADEAVLDARRAATEAPDPAVAAAKLTARAGEAVERARQAWARGDDAAARGVLGALREELSAAEPTIPEAAATLGYVEAVQAAPSTDVAMKRASKVSHDLTR